MNCNDDSFIICKQVQNFIVFKIKMLLPSLYQKIFSPNHSFNV